MAWGLEKTRRPLDRDGYTVIPSAGHKIANSRLNRVLIVTMVLLATTSILSSVAIAWVSFTRSSRDHSYHGSQGQDPPVRLTHCGTTAAAARALGCRFELHNFAWVSPECYDEELSREWDKQAWGFAKTNETPPAEDMIPQEVAMRGELTHAWVPWSQHMAHCALIWKKFHRAVALNRPMDSWTSSYSHSEHCANMLINWELASWPDMYNSDLHLKFPTCGYEWRHQGRQMEERVANESHSRDELEHDQISHDED